MENLFEEATVKAVIKKATPQSAAGPSGLRYSHLQAALCDELVEDLAAFATLVFSSRVLPQVFWTWGVGGGVGAGVLDSENNGGIRWQPSLIGRLS